jgi:RHH-type rel operon transcriptional repressor/antitoxin RelB
VKEVIMTAISLRLPERVAGELEKLATLTERPKSYLIRKAIETYLAEYADYQVALDRLRDKDDAIMSGSELRKQLGL